MTGETGKEFMISSCLVLRNEGRRKREREMDEHEPDAELTPTDPTSASTFTFSNDPDPGPKEAGAYILETGSRLGILVISISRPSKPGGKTTVM